MRASFEQDQKILLFKIRFMTESLMIQPDLKQKAELVVPEFVVLAEEMIISEQKEFIKRYLRNQMCRNLQNVLLDQNSVIPYEELLAPHLLEESPHSRCAISLQHVINGMMIDRRNQCSYDQNAPRKESADKFAFEEEHMKNYIVKESFSTKKKQNGNQAHQL